MTPIRREARTLGLIVALACVPLLVVAVASQVVDRPVRYFTVDPTSLLDGSPYAGLLSNLGAVVWAAAAAACLIGFLALDVRARAPYLWGGLLTTMLLVDDLFLLHETYLATLGFPENVSQGLYSLAVAGYAFAFRRFLARDLPVVALVVVFLGLHELFDELLHDRFFLLEDGAKFVGIVAWAAFFIRSLLRDLGTHRNSAVERGPAEASL